jgi:pimeloyl-ACP methyl ester carboxylesterase
MGSGPPVILLHGTPSSSYLWREVASTLASRFTVYVFDWPGYGQSARGPGINLSWDEQARRLVELIDHWGLDRPAIVAHDIAPVLALRAHLLEGMAAGPLVLADAGLVPPFVTGFSRHVCDHIGVFRAIPTHIAEAMIRRHIETTVSRPTAEDVLDAYMAPWRGTEGVAAYWDAVAAYDEGLARPAVERLEAVDTPMLVLWGADDAWEPAWKADELADLIPGARRQLIAGAGHFAPEDEPAAFADAVAGFLDEVGHR